MNIGTLKRWKINSSYCASLRYVIRQHLEYSIKNTIHKDLKRSRIKRDDNDVIEILSGLRETFVDPFTDQPLLSVSTGMAIDKNLAQELLNALQIGETAMNSFIKERLSKDSEKSIFDPIRKQKLTTFGNLFKKKVIKTKAKVNRFKTVKTCFPKWQSLLNGDQSI